MQTRSEELYKIVASENDLPFDLVKSIGDKVFKSIYDEMRTPTNLILKVKNFGQFIVRSKKIEQEWVRLRDNLCDYDNEDGLSIPDIKEREEYIEKRKRYFVLKHLKTQYDIYKEKKKKYRKLRDEFTQLTAEQKEVQKSSQTICEQHQGLYPSSDKDVDG